MNSPSESKRVRQCGGSVCVCVSNYKTKRNCITFIYSKLRIMNGINLMMSAEENFSFYALNVYVRTVQ